MLGDHVGEIGVTIFSVEETGGQGTSHMGTIPLQPERVHVFKISNCDREGEREREREREKGKGDQGGRGRKEKDERRERFMHLETSLVIFFATTDSLS